MTRVTLPPPLFCWDSRSSTLAGLQNAVGCLAFMRAMLLSLLPFFSERMGFLPVHFSRSEVVWYNNSENLGIRIGTIPFEDIFYGMLLILGNVIFL